MSLENARDFASAPVQERRRIVSESLSAVIAAMEEEWIGTTELIKRIGVAARLEFKLFPVNSNHVANALAALAKAGHKHATHDGTPRELKDGRKVVPWRWWRQEQERPAAPAGPKKPASVAELWARIVALESRIVALEEMRAPISYADLV